MDLKSSSVALAVVNIIHAIPITLRRGPQEPMALWAFVENVETKPLKGKAVKENKEKQNHEIFTYIETKKIA